MKQLAIAQMNFLVGDIEGNLQKVLAASAKAKAQGAQAIVFPELTLTGYPPEDLLLRPGFLRDVEQALARLQQSQQAITVILGYPRERAGRLFNAAGVIANGRLQAEYFKNDLPNYSVFDEKRYFSPGDAPCVVDIAGMPTGLSICEDIWSPQVAAKARQAGARLLLNLNASPYQQGKRGERQQIVRQRVQENRLPVVYVNLVGGQDELVFDGGSFAIDAQGQLVWHAPWFVEDLTSVHLDSGQLQPASCAPLLSPEAETYHALVLGVRDYVEKSGFDGVVLGLSGGIDSALTLAIAVDALGAERVEAVLMPSRYTADMSNEDAIAQAESLGVEYSIIPIEPAFKAFLEMLADEFQGLPSDVTEENIQARCRGIILMAISNKRGRMLLTTGNKSEMSVGYATLYGDMAGGFAPLKDVYKTWVYRLARWRNRHEVVIPERVMTRPPSAELRPDQKDTDSLPSYDILDAILERYVECDQSLEQIIAAGFDPVTVERVLRMVDNNEYKRRQAPPGIKVSKRAYGRDRRYPIVNGYRTKKRSRT